MLCVAWCAALHACCSSDKTGTTGAAKLCCSTLSSHAVITLYKVMLVVLGSSSPLYTLETPATVRGTATVGLFDLVPDCHRSAHRRISYAFFAQTTMVYKEGVTTLFGGRKLPARGLCGRTFKVQLAAKNGAGYSGVATSTASYTMPACPGEEAVEGLGRTGTFVLAAAFSRACIAPSPAAPSIQTTVTCWGVPPEGLLLCYLMWGCLLSSAG